MIRCRPCSDAPIERRCPVRDPLAPVIEGYDLSGIVNPYSFQCTPFYEEGDNGGTLMDGTTIHDILAAKIRLSWTLKALSAQQYADLSAALRSGSSPDTVDAYVFDPTNNIERLARFHITWPAFDFALNTGDFMAFAGSELVLEEANHLARFAFTPPQKTTYTRGETLNLAGLTVTQYDNDGNSTNITSQCDIRPANGTMLVSEGSIRITVALPGGLSDAYTFFIAITASEVLASDTWWTLYKNGFLDIYCTGDMPKGFFSSLSIFYDYRTQIKSVYIRDTVTSIRAYAFKECTNITSVMIPGSVVTIEKYAFSHCSSLKNLTISNGINSIGERAFEYCINLSPTVAIPQSVTSIGDYAFYYSYRITSITIPENVNSIGANPFADCSGLLRIDVANDNQSYVSENGVLFDISKTALISYPVARKDTAYTIPDSVVSVAKSAFRSSQKITSLRTPDGLTTLDEEAFYGCEKLTNLIIPDSVSTIKKDAFNLCGSNTFYGKLQFHLTLPESLTSLEDYALHGCGAISMTIPDGITSIGEKSLSCRCKCVIIPNSVVSVAKSAFESADVIRAVIGEGVTEISERMFYRCGSLENIVIPASVTSIGRFAFLYCDHLSDIYFKGTEEQWEAIDKASAGFPTKHAETGRPPTIHYNSNGETPVHTITYGTWDGSGRTQTVTLPEGIYTYPDHQNIFPPLSGKRFRYWLVPSRNPGSSGYSVCYPGYWYYLYRDISIIAEWS